MMTVLVKLLSFLPSWVKYLPIVALLSIGGYLYWENKSLQEDKLELSNSLAQEQRNNSLLTFQLEDANSRAVKQAQRLQKLQGDTRVAKENNNTQNAILDNYRDKEEIAVENPEDIERRVNQYIDNLLREYQCNTGNTNSCSE